MIRACCSCHATPYLLTSSAEVLQRLVPGLGRTHRSGKPKEATQAAQSGPQPNDSTHKRIPDPSLAMSSPHGSSRSGAGATSDDALIESVINDIVAYDQSSVATSSRIFDASDYHPYDRQIGGAESNDGQSSSTSPFHDYSPGSHAGGSTQGSAGSSR